MVILGSRSPRRAELLGLLIGPDHFRVVPPANSDEPGFDGMRNFSEIRDRLAHIARLKFKDVSSQAGAEDTVITADTTIIAGDDHECIALGQPPEEGWENVVRGWLVEHFSGKTHRAATAVCVGKANTVAATEVCVTEVTFRSLSESDIEWYLRSREPIGKAGGYAIQGLASVFVERIAGSLSNVVGLPLEVVRRLLDRI